MTADIKMNPVIPGLADWANGSLVQEGALHTVQQSGFIFPNKRPNKGQTRNHAI